MTSKEDSGESCCATQQLVFISHGSAGDEHSWQVCDAIRDALVRAGYQAFLDRYSIDRQAEWRPQIDEQMSDCHAAVFVIGRNALDREWIRRESAVLRHYYNLDKDRFLLVILLDGLQPEDLGDHGLDDLTIKQAIKYPGKPKPHDVAADVVDEFAPLPRLPGEDEPMRLWIERVSSMLRKTASSSVLEAAAQLLGLDENGQRKAGRFNGERFLARKLLDAGLGGTVPEAVIHLDAALGSDGRKLAEEIASTWVDEEASRSLLPGRDTDAGQAVVLNAQAVETASHYIERAMRRNTARYLDGDADVLVSDETAELVKGDLEAALERLLGPRSRGQWNRPERMHVYLIIPAPGRTRRRMLAAAIEEIRRQTPWLHVIAVMDGDPPDERQRSQWGLDDALVVFPVLGDEQEVLGHSRVARLYRAVGMSYPHPLWKRTG